MTENDSGVPTNRIHITTAKKTLITGDSIPPPPISHRCMISVVQKYSKSGTKVRDIIADITLYNIKSFSSVVLFIGGNDSLSGTDIELFEEKYDQLV